MTSCNSIFNVYIADGFADDCDELIHRCTQWSTLSYEKFCDVWKEMHFGAIFHGRSSSAELAELSEEVLHIAKRYMIMNSINFEETVAGLFLVYGLLNIQPFSNFASVRFTPDDVVAVDRIEFEARRTRRQDVLYILGAVLIKGPCQFHVTERERGMEFSIRKYLEGQTTVDNQGARPKGVFFRQNEELDIIRELGRLNKLYKDAKTSLGVSDKSLKYVDENLAGDLDKSLKRIIGGSSANDDDNEGTGDENDESSPPSGENAQSIKYKALRSSIQPMRHLIGIQERKTRARRSSTKSKEGISPPKGRTNSNKRRPKRRFGPHRKRGRKKNVEIETDSEEEDDIEYISLSDTDDDEDSDAEDDSAEEPDIEVGRDFQVQVQSLPTLDSNGPEYEIEFIDFQNLNRSDLTPEEGDNEERDKEEGDKETDNDIGECSAIDEATSSDNDKFKKPVLDALLLKRLDKRQLKKPRVQTKFQRMGMLPVANFKDKRKKYK